MGLLAVASAAAQPFPATIALPGGFRPEGIAIGAGNDFYAGSIPTGAIYKGDLRTGEGDVLVPAQPGRAAIGLSYDRGLLWVAGGPTGRGFVYDAQTGANVADFLFTAGPTFVNDVVVAKDAAWFTDSQQPQLYRVPIGRNGLPAGDAETVPLTGDFVMAPGFNLNGIDATPDGRTLVVVQSNTGTLYSVDAATGEATAIDLGGESVPAGDGILLDGKTLYVVQNQLNVVSKIRLARDLESGVLLSRTTDPGFDVPTTVAEKGNSLYLVNARFSTPPTPDTEYWITRIAKP
jgi:sugar lactone lactonase YvrE